MEVYKLAFTGEELDIALEGRIVTEEIFTDKNGVFTPAEGVDGISKIEVRIPHEDDDVCFWDYEGTLVYSCTLAEAQAMTELPEPPDHSQDDIPLTFVEWNWTLEEINDLDRPADVGAMYEPTDGKTHFTLDINERLGLDVTINWYSMSATDPMTFDWGDGTVEDYVAGGTGTQSYTHTYADYGVYHCSIDSNGIGWNPGAASGFITRSTDSNVNEHGRALIGKLVFDSKANWSWPGSQGRYLLFGARIDSIVMPPGATMPANGPTMVRHLNIPRGTTAVGGLKDAYSLRRISIPPTLSTIISDQPLDYAMAGLASIREIRLPKNMAVCGRFLCSGNDALQRIILPDVSSSYLAYNAFNGCRSLKEITIPANVTTIGFGAFANTGILNYYMLGETPPTLEDTTAFNGLSLSTIIHVPAASLEAYQTATNWATYADYMVGDL